ncbi:hypothetical protein CQW23_06028 [Capsicum baccatum]|uniref:Spt5 KOW domain-containing protein n=1 Tax=Capsicum baccatum TaxID=33114 RepID=A0A2G2X233_CAPBA|nr:hypothetical protein CQW23_06028 [Capsicum baccatum]
MVQEASYRWALRLVYGNGLCDGFLNHLHSLTYDDGFRQPLPLLDLWRWIDLRALVNIFDGIEIPKEEKFCPTMRFWSATKAKALGIPVMRQKDSVTGDYFDIVNDFSKIFELGEFVKVVSGGKEGATGTITSVKGHVVTVLPDKSTNILDVLVDHVEENYEVAYCREPPRSNSREVHEITEQNIIEFGFLRFHMPENNVVMHEWWSLAILVALAHLLVLQERLYLETPVALILLPEI